MDGGALARSLPSERVRRSAHRHVEPWFAGVFSRTRAPDCVVCIASDCLLTLSEPLNSRLTPAAKREPCIGRRKPKTSISLMLTLVELAELLLTCDSRQVLGAVAERIGGRGEGESLQTQESIRSRRPVEPLLRRLGTLVAQSWTANIRHGGPGFPLLRFSVPFCLCILDIVDVDSSIALPSTTSFFLTPPFPGSEPSSLFQRDGSGLLLCSARALLSSFFPLLDSLFSSSTSLARGRPTAIMKIAAVLAALAATVWASSPTVSELVKPRQAASAPLPTITVKGNAFFAGDTRFYLRGVAYQSVVSLTQPNLPVLTDILLLDLEEPPMPRTRC